MSANFTCSKKPHVKQSPNVKISDQISIIWYPMILSSTEN